MTELERETIFVRDRDKIRQLKNCDSWDALTLIAVTSSDPRTFDELCRAWLRYRPEQRLEELAWADWDGQPAQDPWILLDLACLRIVYSDNAEMPDDDVAYLRDSGGDRKGNPAVWIHLPLGWTVEEDLPWSEALPPLPVPREPLDVRGVLFGKPVAESIARQAAALAQSGKLPPERLRTSRFERSDPLTQAQRQTLEQWRQLTVQVHAEWLLATRDDLEGQCPRYFLHDGREWLDRELRNLESQWTREGRPPRPLDKDTHAYRFGPLGWHEVVIYFDFCRELLEFAWDQLAKDPHTPVETLASALQAHGQQWLNADTFEGEPMSPRTIIETERRRLPLSRECPPDCDCPMCSVYAGNCGPAFLRFDGYHLELDNQMVFSLC